MHRLEDVDPETLVANPRRNKVEAKLAKTRASLERKRETADKPRKALEAKMPKSAKKREA